jgi:hypothetical protein
MFNIELPYKSATPMKFDSCTKAWLKRSSPHFPLWGVRGFEKITASSVLYFGCSKGFTVP